ncbi:MAG TPA: hypothetical protein VHO03_16845 [Ignavibacteriales bacterium]|nr:hypothetical protein [Ignavibacteriales bacterium]
MLKLLRNRLKVRKSKAFLTWLMDKYPGLDPDHLIGSMGALKLNDFLIVMRTREDHAKRHDKGFEDFDLELCKALENLFDYTEHLEKENTELKEKLEA